MSVDTIGMSDTEVVGAVDTEFEEPEGVSLPPEISRKFILPVEPRTVVEM